MKRLFLLLLTIILLLSMASCGGYNGIMREHLSDEDNYYAIDAIFCSYKKADNRIYLYVTIEDRSVFDFSEANSETLRLELVGGNCDAFDEILAKADIREGDRIAVKCTTWIYLDSTYYYIAEIKTQDETLLPFKDGLANIVKYMNDHKSLF